MTSSNFGISAEDWRFFVVFFCDPKLNETTDLKKRLVPLLPNVETVFSCFIICHRDLVIPSLSGKSELSKILPANVFQSLSNLSENAEA